MLATFLFVAAVETQPSPEESRIELTKLDLRIAEVVLDAFEADTGKLPLVEDGCLLLDAPQVDLGSTYGRRLPVKDAWGHPMRMWLVDSDLYLSSDGPDGMPDFAPFEDEDEYVINDDLVLDDGDFLDPGVPTISSLVMLGHAIDAYGADRGVYPGPTDGLVPVSQLTAILVPTYIRALPTLDNWGNPILVYSQPTGYFLVSFGSDRRADREYDPRKTGQWPEGAGPVAAETCDALFVDGRFVQWPQSADGGE